MKKFLLIFLLVVGSTAMAQPTSGDITIETTDGMDTTLVAIAQLKPIDAVLTSSFTEGNSNLLATYFGENVDLSIAGKANLYSKSQAKQILQHFFTDNPPKSFNIIHKGKAEKTEYYIGEFVSNNGKEFRVTVNSKLVGKRNLINSLSIEEN